MELGSVIVKYAECKLRPDTPENIVASRTNDQDISTLSNFDNLRLQARLT